MPVPLLEFSNVTVAREERTVLNAINLSIGVGEHVAILGPNGSGKSSLIKVVTRELYPVLNAGPSSLRILGEDHWNVFDLRVLLGIVSNDLLAACTREFSGREVILSGFFSSIGLWPHLVVTSAMEEKGREILELLEIPHLADQSVDEMSSGEARRVLIGRALVHDPKALVLDEPTASLDINASHELRQILRKLAQSGISILMVTHHLADIIPEIQRVVFMKEGRLVQDGAKDELLQAEPLSRLFGTPVDVARRDGYFHMW